MKFCTHCAGRLQFAVPQGDDRVRAICSQCRAIHYVNPKIVAGCLALWEDRILMCRRAIEPRRGYWTLPCGYMEEGETVEAAACRETREESLATVSIRRLYSIVSLPEISQVYLVFLADLQTPSFGPTAESAEVSLLRPDEIPWSALAFPAVEYVLRAFVTNGTGAGELHMGSCTRAPGTFLEELE